MFSAAQNFFEYLLRYEKVLINKVEYWVGITFDTRHLTPGTIVKVWRKDGRLNMMLNFRVKF